MSAPNDLRHQQAERIWQLEKELTAERTARETAERELEAYKSLWDEEHQITLSFVNQIDALRAKLAALEVQTATPVIDLDKISWDLIKDAASKSPWMPPEYMMNDWVSDIVSFLTKGAPSASRF